MKRFVLTASLFSFVISSCGKNDSSSEEDTGLGSVDERFKGIIESLPIVESFDVYTGRFPVELANNIVVPFFPGLTEVVTTNGSTTTNTLALKRKNAGDFIFVRLGHKMHGFLLWD